MESKWQMHIRFWWGNMERDHFADLGVDWRIDIKMDLETGQDCDKWWAPVNMDS